MVVSSAKYCSFWSYEFFFPIIVFFLWLLFSHFQYALHIKSTNSNLYIDSQVTVWSHKLNSLSEISPALSFLGHFLGFSGNVFCLPCNTSSISVNCLVKFWSTNSKLFSKTTEFCPFLDKIFGHFSWIQSYLLLFRYPLHFEAGKSPWNTDCFIIFWIHNFKPYWSYVNLFPWSILMVRQGG